MTTKVNPQIGMEDRIVDDKELETQLEKRLNLKESVAEYNKINKDVKARLSSIETPVPYRVGRFIIDRKIVEPREVSFETSESVRFSIKLASDD